MWKADTMNSLAKYRNRVWQGESGVRSFHFLRCTLFTQRPVLTLKALSLPSIDSMLLAHSLCKSRVAFGSGVLLLNRRRHHVLVPWRRLLALHSRHTSAHKNRNWEGWLYFIMCAKNLESHWLHFFYSSHLSVCRIRRIHWDERRE